MCVCVFVPSPWSANFLITRSNLSFSFLNSISWLGGDCTIIKAFSDLDLEGEEEEVGVEGGDLSEKVEGEEGVGLRRLNGDEPNIGEWDDMGR